MNQSIHVEPKDICEGDITAMVKALLACAGAPLAVRWAQIVREGGDRAAHSHKDGEHE